MLLPGSAQTATKLHSDADDGLKPFHHCFLPQYKQVYSCPSRYKSPPQLGQPFSFQRGSLRPRRTWKGSPAAAYFLFSCSDNLRCFIVHTSASCYFGNLLLFPLPAKGSRMWHQLVDISNTKGPEASLAKEKARAVSKIFAWILDKPISN